MTRSRTDPPSVGDIFRPLSGSEGTSRPGDGAAARGPRVLLFLHEDCPSCDMWVRGELGPVEDDIRGWGGRTVTLTSDRQGRDPQAAWLAVLDEWDEVFHVARIGPDHTFPAPADLVEWVRFVAIQCPECESPEGRWRR